MLETNLLQQLWFHNCQFETDATSRAIDMGLSVHESLVDFRWFHPDDEHTSETKGSQRMIVLIRVYTHRTFPF